ncbi:MAG: extracellular matrix/biofilm regulator RemA [Bacilli bacterium]
MTVQLINIGFGNMAASNRIVSITGPESAPIKRLIQDARESGKLIDATYGRRTRAVIVCDSDHVILCAVQPETVAHRIGADPRAEPAADEAEEAVEAVE